MSMTSYLDFAENDFKYFIHSYKSRFIANAMAVNAQETCEKYMRYLIDTYFVPETEQEKEDFNIVMETHNLIRLMRFLETNLHLTFPIEAKRDMQIINGYYFTARYPGNESIEVTQEDLDLCAQAVQNCRQVIYDFINQMEEK